MQELNQLQDKLALLLKKHATLKAENKRLKDNIGEQSNAIDTLNAKVETMEQRVLSTQLGNPSLNNEEKEIMRKQLDIVIGEIDKILTKLND
jgi:predicted nuclease with TOPRIM domain